jgi:hypothetical protein
LQANGQYSALIIGLTPFWIPISSSKACGCSIPISVGARAPSRRC